MAPTVAPSVAPTTAPVSVVTLIEAFITSSMENDRKHAAEIAELRTSQKIARKTTEELRQKSSKQEAELKMLREKINGLKISKNDCRVETLDGEKKDNRAIKFCTV